MATRIGVSNFVYAKMTTEDTAATAPAYSTPQAAPGLMSLNINPNGSTDTLFADDGPLETATTIGQVEVEIQKNYLSTKNKVDLLGKKTDSKGGLVSSSNDVPPWVAIGFKSLKSNGHYRYCWLYKGKFQDPEDNNETKGDSINWQSDTINGNFVRLMFGYTIDDETKFPYKYEMDEDDTTADTETIASWFTKVTMPATGASVVPTAAVAPNKSVALSTDETDQPAVDSTTNDWTALPSATN